MQVYDSRQKMLGTLWVIYGLICVIKATWIVVYAPTLTLMWGALLNRVADPFFWMNLFHGAMWGVVALEIVTAILSFVAAASLLRDRRSTGSVALIAGFLALLTGPLGIAVGVYTIIALLPRNAGQARPTLVSAA
jgi:hypothetical protein